MSHLVLLWLAPSGPRLHPLLPLHGVTVSHTSGCDHTPLPPVITPSDPIPLSLWIHRGTDDTPRLSSVCGSIVQILTGASALCYCDPFQGDTVTRDMPLRPVS